MRTLTQLLEADEQQSNNQDQNNNNDQQDNKNKSVKMDAGTCKVWPAFNTTVKGWIKVMSGQEEAKDSFFDGGFLIPTNIQSLAGNSQAKTATLSKQLDSACKVSIIEYSNDYMFLIDGIKPSYVSTGWDKNKGPKIADVIKAMKQEGAAKADQQNNDKQGNDNGNNDNGGTM